MSDNVKNIIDSANLELSFRNAIYNFDCFVNRDELGNVTQNYFRIQGTRFQFIIGGLYIFDGFERKIKDFSYNHNYTVNENAEIARKTIFDYTERQIKDDMFHLQRKLIILNKAKDRFCI